MKTEFILTTLFWSFVPSTLTSILQRSLYYLTGMNPLPPRRRMHQSIIFSIVILSYFAFSIIRTQMNIEPNYYSVLDVPIDFASKELKMNYRSLSLQYHPDKNGHLSQDQRDLYHEKYLSIRKAYEVLGDKNTQFAYEKFSDTMLDCNNCRTKKDFMMNGLLNFVAYHGVSSLLVFFMDLFYSGNNKFWRYYFLFGQIAIELWLLISKGDPLNGYFYPSLTTGERITMIRSIGVSGFMALSAILSLWNVKLKPSSASLAELYHLNNMISTETGKWYKWMYEPFNSPSKSKYLQQKMKDLAFKTRVEKHIDLKKIK